MRSTSEKEFTALVVLQVPSTVMWQHVLLLNNIFQVIYLIRFIESVFFATVVSIVLVKVAQAYTWLC